MRVYAADDYKEAKIMRTQVSSFLGEWNLAKLDPNNAAEFTVSFFTHNMLHRILITVLHSSSKLQRLEGLPSLVTKMLSPAF